MSNTKVSRRDFVKASAMAATLTGVTAPFNILAAGESPNSRVNGVMLGCGWRGSQLLPLWKGISNVIAVCDPKELTKDKTLIKNLYSKCAYNTVVKGVENNIYDGLTRYPDYRKMFDKIGKDIDCVFMHMRCGNNFHVAMTAMEMGKHVYVAKPMCYTVEEARRMRIIANEKKLITQLGTQGHSRGGPDLLREWVNKGWLGDNIEVHSPAGNVAYMERKLKPEPIPSILNWDVFQGPAKVTTFNKLYSNKASSVKDFTIGGGGEIGIHNLDGAFYSIDVEYPKSFAIVDMPVGEAVKFIFPKKNGKDINVYLYHGKKDYTKLPVSRKIDLIKDKKSLGGFGPNFIIGSKETALSQSMSSASIWDYDRMKNFVAEHGKINPAKYAKNHMGSFIQAIKDNKPKDTMANFNYASLIMEMLCLNHIALNVDKKKKGKVFEYDYKNMKIINDEEANALLCREYREGFKI